MEASVKLQNENKRLSELYSYRILDTPEEKDYNDLAHLASQICGAPISLISFVDRDRVWYKAAVGMDMKESPRENSICAKTIEQPGLMLAYENDLSDYNLANKTPFRFYAGITLVSPSGFSLGTLCILDHEHKTLSDQQVASLKIIAHQIINLMNLRINISNLQNAKTKILESELMFKSLAQGAPVGIFQTNQKGIGIYVNQKWCEIVGVSEREAYSIQWVATIHPEDQQRFLNVWARAFSTKEDFNLNFRFQNKERQTRWVKAHASPLFNEQKIFTGYVGTLEDITKRKLVEGKLEEKEKLFNLIALNSKDILTIFEANDEARCLYVSPSCQEILGYSPEELIGLSPFEMMPVEQATLLKKVYLPEILKGNSTRTESQLRKSDGSFIWVEALSKPIYDVNGKILTFQSSVREISERKKFEEQLKQEKEKAEESTKAKSHFLSTMSHEIRTPMNAVIGLTNLLLTDNPRPDQEHCLNLLKFSGENLLELLNDILDFNKIEAGKIELEKISFNIKNTIQKLVDLQKSRATAKGLELRVNFDEQLPQFTIGDPLRLGQIINNLMSNAIKFTEQGYVALEVKLLEKAQDVCTLEFAVSDTGIGIAADKLSAIFENFSQASSDISRKFGGTGLGLAISKKLLNLMGTDINVESTLGSGTTFSFSINLSLANSKNENQQVKDFSKNYSELSVLLVEDNPVNQLVAGNFLKRWGMIVTFANNGQEALQKINEKKFDVVLMDLQMPEMDGYEATSCIRNRNDEYSKTVPILALTASVLPEIKLRAERIGFTDFVTKPFQPNDLLNAILRHTTQKSLAEKNNYDAAA